ncbi:hypothetical protein [Methanocella sp. MCL-LM]|uniref:hypothetical protein n=1 Tax=Methanocella sp. MCL-LM TaxID=3412035 RepID=UPI003C76D150
MTSEVSPTVYVVCEDRPQQAVMRKILLSRGIIPGRTYGCNGYGFIKTNIRRYNQPTVKMPFFALTDLDDRNICPGRLVEEWLGVPTPRPDLVFRVAVREIESWLMADSDHFQEYFGIPYGNIPKNVDDEISDPKIHLFDIIGRTSRKGDIKREVLPRGKARIGPLYNDHMEKYVYNYWDIDAARQRSRSLSRTVERIDDLKDLLLQQSN